MPETRRRAKVEDPQLTFQRGQEACRRLIRILAAPDPTAQLVAAQAFIEVDALLAARIQQAKASEPSSDPWPGERGRAAMLARRQASE